MCAALPVPWFAANDGLLRVFLVFLPCDSSLFVERLRVFHCRLQLFELI